MASALQGAIASAQLTTDAMAGIASMVTSTLNRATQERQIQSNILEGMVRSAQNAKQMEMDEFFKGQELKLRERQLEIDSQYKNIGIGMDNMRLINDNKRLDLEERRVAAYEEKMADADKYKDYSLGLNKQAVDLDISIKEQSRKLLQDKESLEAEIYGREKSGNNPAIRGMTRKQMLDDEENPNGKIAQLKRLQNESVKALEEKQMMLEKIRNEQNHVNLGGEPGTFLPLPKPKNTSSNNTNRIEGIDSSLFPTLPDSASDTAKAGLRMINEEIAMLEGQVPEYIEQEPISQDEESKIIAKKDQRYISSIFDPSVPLDEVPELIDALSPKGKADLEMKKGIYESGFLSDYGATKSYDFSKQYNPDSKASEQMSEMYARSGGNPIELNLLKAEAETKLITLRAEANAKAAVNSDDTTFSVDTFVANEYNKWVSDRLVKQEEVVKDNVSSGIKTGAVIAPDGTLPGVRRLASTETKGESLDDLLGKYTVSAEGRKIKEKEDKDIELYDQFSKGFIKTEGGFDRRAFAETALQQPALLYAVLGNERINLEYSEAGYSEKEVEDVTNANYRKLIEKMKKLQAPEAFRMWKEASKFIK